VNSDVDVVVKLSDDGVESMLKEARSWREHPDGVDLNCFPAKSLQSGVRLVDDWEWLDNKDPKVAASIWAGRKFAWSCHRLLGWDVQCVQSAYVPIVRIIAGVDRKSGVACEVPSIFRQNPPEDCSLRVM